MSESSHKLYVDTRLQAYEGYLPDHWMEQALQATTAAPRLERPLIDLCLNWRTTSYAVSMPSIFVKSLRESTLSFASYTSPDGSVVGMIDAVLAKLSSRLPEVAESRPLRGRLAEELAKLAAEARSTREAVEPDMPLEPIWQRFLAVVPFSMSVWASQRIGYVAFYNSYKAFLIQVLKTLLGVAILRTRDKEFKNALRTGFTGKDVLDACWANHNLNVARLVRHALSHNSGRQTEDLSKQHHNIKLIEEVLQIAPDDNHRLLAALRSAVDAFISAAAGHPRFTAPYAVLRPQDG